MKRKLSLLLMTALLATTLAACTSSSGGDASTTPAETSNAASEEKTQEADAAPADTGTTQEAEVAETEADELEGEITFWHSFTQGPRMENIQAAAEAFMTDHPKVKINIETYSWGDFYTKWTTGLASGNVPDMSTARAGEVVEMINADAILPLDDLIDSIGRARFYESPIQEMTYSDGNCYAVPIYSHAFVMWYRKDLLEKYNLEVPKTWDEFNEAATAITQGENGEVYGCSVPMGTNDLYATCFLDTYVGSNRESLITQDRKPNLTSPTALEGIQYWVDMYKNNSPADSINFNTLDQATLYYQGKNAFDFNSGFHISGVEANTPELLDYIDCAPVPTINGDGNPDYIVNNMPMVVWKNSAHPEICKAFIEYFYEPDNYIPFLHSVPVGMMPALKEITNDPAFLNNDTIKKYQNAMETISDALSHGTYIAMEYGPCVEAGILANQRVIENMFQDIVLNGTPVEEAAQAAEEQLLELFSAAE